MSGADATHGCCEIEFGGEHVILSPECAVWWPRCSTVFVSDVHLGKAAAFRAAGVPVPEATTAATLSRLTSVIERFEAARVVVLGDLVHARSGVTDRLRSNVASWRVLHRRTAIVLVVGNHDRSAGGVPGEWDIEQIEPGSNVGPFEVVHLPSERSGEPGMPALAGHVHPAVRISHRPSRTSSRYQAFWLKDQMLVLPAFGAFTGTCLVRPAEHDDIYVIADGSVHEMNVCSN